MDEEKTTQTWIERRSEWRGILNLTKSHERAKTWKKSFTEFHFEIPLIFSCARFRHVLLELSFHCQHSFTLSEIHKMWSWVFTFPHLFFFCRNRVCEAASVSFNIWFQLNKLSEWKIHSNSGCPAFFLLSISVFRRAHFPLDSFLFLLICVCWSFLICHVNTKSIQTTCKTEFEMQVIVWTFDEYVTTIKTSQKSLQSDSRMLFDSDKKGNYYFALPFFCGQNQFLLYFFGVSLSMNETHVRSEPKSACSFSSGYKVSASEKCKKKLFVETHTRFGFLLFLFRFYFGFFSRFVAFGFVKKRQMSKKHKWNETETKRKKRKIHFRIFFSFEMISLAERCFAQFDDDTTPTREIKKKKKMKWNGTWWWRQREMPNAKTQRFLSGKKEKTPRN